MQSILLILIFSVIFDGFFVIANITMCLNNLSVNITKGVEDGITMDGVRYEDENYLKIENETLSCVCNIKMCIRKCCNENESMFHKCELTRNNRLNISFYDITVKNDSVHLRDFHMVYGYKCPAGFIAARSLGNIYVQTNGSLFYTEENYQHLYDIQNYCIDDFNGSTSALLCEPDVVVKTKYYVKVNGMIISMPFLLATFLVYLILPERNLHRKALMSYVFTLLAAYITLVTIQMYPYQFKPVPCQILGYCIIFFFLVSFFWMNVMCIDMWLAFSGMRTVMSKKYAERKRFIIYCIYAWGTPIIHVGIVLLLNTHSPPDADYYPKIGDPRCFLGDGMPTFYYFYLPMAIIIGINIVFFILTTVRIQQIKKETSMLKQTESKKSYEDDKQKFNLYLKLMFAMGINWIMELISWTVEKLLRDTPTFIWYLSDFTNAMYGVLIFVIFVFKKKIWQSLKKRYYVFIGKPHLAHSFTTSSARGTRASNYSTTDTAVSTDYRLNDMKRIPEESALNRT
ncbi:G-protein coupled receptor Mth2-like isoform X5 [Diorhabda sublineata]|uniref:G-protein coupled receptor Mth2-like isoform X5 n=1 Tax=Diorhabda sublineata TaxID=1163346 RepID=UPI0024E12BD7|nr:G-protein coupled receptor Mth2-like isoform X5 [Diorhabda sublineata]